MNLTAGRRAHTDSLGLLEVGVGLHPASGKVLTNDLDASSVGNIFAIGDVADVSVLENRMAAKNRVSLLLLATQLCGQHLVWWAVYRCNACSLLTEQVGADSSGHPGRQAAG